MKVRFLVGCIKINKSIFGTPSISSFYFFSSIKKVTKKSSLMIFFCKIIQFFCQHHPDRLSNRFTSNEALWVASSANAKKFNILQRKKSYDGLFKQ
ncbi:MAG: hypothetical protein A3F91_00280 [Flavobacteria bacterium RIFCSPLOWO2_12_FULL_35_11]|nr:MAG: hypothetical protein A3F91_00280 [Flavobacteria bacterium RIFCSPLOWO2_12_FULL_35_11]